ncbi:MAG: recombinase family protein [Epulopiscium sp.]|nr:recombinase family protein [Candidatus Epulonipiscium sp.]
MKYACYCRVSTKKDEQLDSLETQIKYFQHLAKEKKFDIYEIYYDEGITGSQIKNRDGYNRMIEDAEAKKFDVILVKDITRIMRNTLLFLELYKDLQKWGINLAFTNYGNMDIETADKNYLTMLASFAEDEARRLGQRVKFTKDITAKKGRVPNIVYGYKKIDKYTLEIIPEEAEVVKRMFDYYTNDKLGTARIAEILNEEGILTKRNKGKWSQKTVIDILRNRLYIGDVINKKSENRGYPETRRVQLPESEWVIVKREDFRIISDEQFWEAEEILDGRKYQFHANRKRERQSYKYPFSTAIKCMDCADPKKNSYYSFRRNVRKYSKSGKTYIWWCCSYRNAHGANSCPNTITIDERDFEEQLITFFKSYFLDNKKSMSEAVLEVLKRKLEEQNQDVGEENPEDLSAIADEIDKLEKQKKNYVEMGGEGIITFQEVREYVTPINKKLEELKLQYSRMNNEKNIKESDINKLISNFFENIEKTIEGDKINNQYLKRLVDIKSRHDGAIFIDLKFDDNEELKVSNLPFNELVENLKSEEVAN